MQKNMFGLVALVLITASAAGCAGGQPEAAPDAMKTDALEIETAPATGTQQPKITQTVETSIEPEATSCALTLPGMEDWEIVLCETFDDNRNAWEVESQDNAYSVYTSDIVDGKLVVDYAAKVFGGFQKTALTWFTIGDEKDFVLSVKGLMDSAFQDVSWGIAFRGDGDSFFLFSIANNGTYTFEIYENSGWIPLITTKAYNGIRLGEENTMRIEAGGQDFYFSINGEMVNQFSGGLLKGTQILLVVSAKEGANAVFTFDDVVLQR